jgi:hypothetical protein
MIKSPSQRRRFCSLEDSGTGRAQIRRELLVFAWNLRSLDTPFGRRSLALNTIEHGRAWHWRLLPPGWVDIAFILRHGQLKTKRAFAAFFTSLNTKIQPPKQAVRKKREAAETPVPWETVKAVFAQNPKLRHLGVLAGAQALNNEHLENTFGRFSYDIDLHTAKDMGQVHALLTAEDRKRIHLVSRSNPEMYVYEVDAGLRQVKLEIAKPFLPHKLAPVSSKHIPGLKVVQFADLIYAKVSALSTRRFVRDLVDLYAANEQKTVNWRRLLIKASSEPENDYSPVEFENSLQILEQELQSDTPDIPCERPPEISDLKAFLGELRTVNVAVARELARSEGNDADME